MEAGKEEKEERSFSLEYSSEEETQATVTSAPVSSTTAGHQYHFQALEEGQGQANPQ